MANGIRPRLNLSTARQIIAGTTTSEKVRANGRLAPEDHILLKMAQHGLSIVNRRRPPTAAELEKLHPKLHGLVMGLRTNGLESKYKANGLDRAFMEAREQRANVAEWKAEYGRLLRLPRSKKRVAYWTPNGPVSVEEHRSKQPPRSPKRAK